MLPFSSRTVAATAALRAAAGAMYRPEHVDTHEDSAPSYPGTGSVQHTFEGAATYALSGAWQRKPRR
jgi:hypothetical protein